MSRCFVPPYLLRHIASVDPDVAAALQHTLEIDARIRDSRSSGMPPAAAPDGAWTVHTAGNEETLPGRAVRSAGEPESGDAAVDEAATGIVASLELTTALGRDSFDGQGAAVSATVHYGRDYANAFWDGQQLVFGDGDGRIFDRFTKPVDVVAHEFAHAVTQYAAGLVYQDQPGALNESVSDVFAACMRQRLLDQQAGEGDWLIGVGLFLPGVSARALRDMREPGTAYDDPVLGQDPQVGHLDDYVETEDDNGGVHLNSGIPNRAFHLAATAIGGTAWEGAGRIWWSALTGGEVRPDTDFAGFAAITVAAAGGQRAAVEEAWEQVGVTPGAARPTTPRATPTADDRRADVVVVRRSGGFTGRTVEGQRDLAADDPATAEARALVESLSLDEATAGTPMPDMFTYTFELPGRPPVTVVQQQLTPELRRLADLVLGDDDSASTV